MSKRTEKWFSHRIGKEVSVARWGEVGTPVLLFPTAGGDSEEIERFHMIDVLGDLLAAGRIKVYSVDSLAGRSWLAENDDIRHAGQVQHRFDDVIVQEVLPWIRGDCGGDAHGLIVAGASLGAFNALAAICRHPDLFAKAICMSGSYDVSRFLRGRPDEQFTWCSPMHFVPRLAEDDARLQLLRQRFVLITYGGGRWENPDENWKLAEVLGARGIPNRVDAWGPEWDHDWVTWRRMLPQYLDDLL